MTEQSASSTSGNGVGMWTKQCEDGLNNLINMELYSSYMYLGMGHFFDQDNVALKNVAKFFLESSNKKQEHVNKMIVYHNQRGGTTVYFNIKPPGPFDVITFNTLKAMQCALALEVDVNKTLLNLCDVADCDPEFQDFVEANFLHKRVEIIKMLKDYITNLKRVGNGLGEYMFNKHFLQD